MSAKGGDSRLQPARGFMSGMLMVIVWYLVRSVRYLVVLFQIEQ